MNFKGQVITFRSEAVEADLLLVTKLSGVERMSGLFEFSIELICPRADLDLEAVLYAPSRLGLEVPVALGDGQFGTTTREIAGILAALEQSEKGQGWTKYRATFVPKLWQLTRSFRSRIFMDKTVDQMVGAVLESDGLSPQIDFEWKLSRQGNAGPTPERAIYPQREYVVQYEESDWDFVVRWLEHEGIWFYFVNADGDGQQSTEKVVFGDTPSTYGASEFESNIPYRPESEGKGNDRREAGQVTTFRCRQQRLPTKVAVNDYNWRTPSAELLLEAKVHEQGTGVQVEYNDHFKTSDQGEAIATLRAEELSCRARWFHGESDCRTLRVGHTFTLREHYRDDWNDSYLVVELHHQAEQMISLESSSVTGVKYANSFQCIPASQPFRPERRTAWPSIKGVMHARVDAEGDGKYAELDAFGRYKLVFPFDEHAAEAKPGKASRWVRLAQPYAGPGGGMHFPLLKGTEVLVTHIDGDPDRPIIAGAVPNAEMPGPTSADNPSQNTIRTATGNVLQFDDNENASGFFSADARSSKVIDARWRGGSGAGAGGAGGAAGSNGGNGGPQLPNVTPAARTAQKAAAVPAAAAQPAAADAATPKAPAPAAGDSSDLPGAGLGMPEIVSTIWDTGLDNETDTVIPAWRTFFGRNASGRNVAFDDIATNGRYVDQQTEPDKKKRDENKLKLSVAENLLPTDQTLTEANCVTLLNHVLLKHPRYAEFESLGQIAQIGQSTPTASQPIANPLRDTALTGAAAGLARVAQNFEGTVAGSQLAVSLGDAITLKVGDSYEYTDGSFAIKVGTGGYGREETRGDQTKDTYNYGKTTEATYTYGDKQSTSTFLANQGEKSYFMGNKTSVALQLSGTEAVSLTGGAATENALKLGAFNALSINLLAVGEMSLLVGGKLQMEINAAVVLKVQLGGKLEFETTNFKAIMKSDKVALQNFRANLKDDCADLVASKSQLQTVENALSQTNNKLSEASNTLSEVENTLSEQANQLSQTQNSLSKTQTVLQKSVTALATSMRTLANQQTAAVHLIS